jgi:hypothetical protein
LISLGGRKLQQEAFQITITQGCVVGPSLCCPVRQCQSQRRWSPTAGRNKRVRRGWERYCREGSGSLEARWRELPRVSNVRSRRRTHMFT